MYERNQKSWAKHIDFMILDAICLELSLLISYVIRFNIESIRILFSNSPWADPYQKDIWLILLLHGIIIFMTAPYSGILKRNGAREGRKVLTYNIYAGRISYDYVHRAFFLALFPDFNIPVSCHCFFYDVGMS